MHVSTLAEEVSSLGQGSGAGVGQEGTDVGQANASSAQHCGSLATVDVLDVCVVDDQKLSAGADAEFMLASDLLSTIEPSDV